MMIRSLALLAAVVGCRGPSTLERWLPRWEAARACLVGSPAQSDLETSMTIESLREGRDRCAEERAKLRVSAPAALSNHLDELSRSMSPAAVRRIDDVVEEKARSEGLSLPARSAVTIPELTGAREISLAGTTNVDLWTQRSPLVVRSEDADATTYREVHAIDDVREHTVPPSHHLAFPSRTWAARAADRVLSVANVQTGAPGAPRVEVSLPDDYIVKAAIDSGLARTIVLDSAAGRGFAFAHSSDGGRRWKVDAEPKHLTLTQVARPRPRDSSTSSAK